MPLLLIGASIGLFVVYTNPAYEGANGVKGLQAQVKSYDDALNKSQELKEVRDKLVSKFNTFSPDDKTKLQEMLPDNVDNIRLAIDINNIAAKHSLSIKNLSVGNSQNKNTKNAAAVGASSGPIGSVELGFSVTSSYDTFLAFLSDLEHSLRVVDVESVSFAASDTGINDYTLTIRTYWLH